MKIPFNRPTIVGNELEYIKDAVESGKISGDGKYTKLCSEFLENTFKAKKVMLTTSCTHALEMSAILLNIGEGDEVIMPSFTFVSTVNAFCLRGAKPIFVDIREDTKNIDEDLIEERITDRTKAIVPVHYAGVSCDMSRIMEISKKYSIPAVEDAAQGVNSTYEGEFLGTIGDMGAYSFHETKNFISGEGGAIILNNEEYIERAEIIREKGTNRSKFYRGEVDKYTWVDIGSSYLPSDLLAAFLYAQFEKMDEITEKRLKLFTNYINSLKILEDRNLISLPYIPDNCTINGHIFYIMLNDPKTRDGLMHFLKQKEILSVFHYVPLHTSPMGRMYGYGEGDLKVTEFVSERLLRLPYYYDLKDDEQKYIVESIKEYFNN